jgi:type III secretion protein C
MKSLYLLFLLLINLDICGNTAQSPGILVNFESIELKELSTFVGSITQTNFIFKDDIKDCKIHFVCHRRLQDDELLQHFEQILTGYDLLMEKVGNVYHIKKKDPALIEKQLRMIQQNEFHIIKLQFHPGSEVIEAIKNASIGLSSEQQHLKTALESTQWIKSTNSIVFSAPAGIDKEVENLIKKLDVPLKQVFIEVLVLDTSMKQGLDFGLDWSLESSSSSFKPSIHQDLASKNPLGFNLGIIGDLVRYKGSSFITLSSLVSAVEHESQVKIVLNQKVIAQDNRPSKIFVGDNLPFAGATVHTSGQSQQTTANIDYKDVGVSLLITPLIGDDGIITLNIVEEISEAMKHSSDQPLSGIQTTKTNMSTSAHVPNSHFLILSGMARNAKVNRTSGVPVLQHIPLLGRLFKRTEDGEEKRSIIIFVKPEIVETAHFLKPN